MGMNCHSEKVKLPALLLNSASYAQTRSVPVARDMRV